MFRFAMGVLTLFTLFCSVFAAAVQHRSDRAGGKLAVYYGQGPDQKLLGHFCEDETIDIIPIGFVSALPGNPKSMNGYPTLNFGNQCGGYWTDPQGHETGMFRNCAQMIPDIKKCQKAGKKILLSIGGDSSVYFQNSTAGADFARFMWGAFGPYNASWNGPRPFGNETVLDGFDFDIETVQKNSPVPVDTGLANAANTFRQLMGIGRLITAAPQCIVPDAIFQNVLNHASFDAVLIQFYNTPYCSARSSFDSSFGNGISYDAWVEWLQSNSFNKDIKAYIGLPASPENYFYLQPSEAQTLINKYRQKWPTIFGGVMLWEATTSENNQIEGMSYAGVMKKILQDKWSSNSSSTTATTMTTTSNTSTTQYTASTTRQTGNSWSVITSDRSMTVNCTLPPGESATVTTTVTLTSTIYTTVDPTVAPTNGTVGYKNH